jgi:hypothetical protein
MVSRILKASENNFELKKENSQFTLSNQSSWVGVNPGSIDGCVAYWNMNEGTGSIAYDSVGGNNGSLINGVSWVQGRIGSGVFLGSPAYINCFRPENLLISGELSISSWIYMVSGNTGIAPEFYDIISNKNDGLYEIAVRPYEFDYRGGASSVNIPYNFSYLKYYNINVIRLNVGPTVNNILVYVDGIYIGSRNVSIVTDKGYNISLGRRGGEENVWFKGIIDEVGIWNRALSDNEITQIYNYGYPKFKTLTNHNQHITLKEVA